MILTFGNQTKLQYSLKISIFNANHGKTDLRGNKSFYLPIFSENKH